MASHRLIGWIYWDPVGIANYAATGVPDGIGYYIATRAAPLASAGSQVVTAALGSIHPDFVRVSMELADQHSSFVEAARCRDAAVVAGLETHVPEILEDLGSMADELWAVADELPSAGRVMFAAHRAWPRPESPGSLRAWLALNCIREWRGDTHWALQIAEGLSSTAAGLLDGAWRGYEDDWLPRCSDAAATEIDAAMAELAERGFVTDGRIDAAGVAYRQSLEDRLDDLAALPWQLWGETATRRFIDLVEPVGETLLARVDATAGPQWMPAARTRRSDLLGADIDKGTT